jgi:hypothetical protein
MKSGIIFLWKRKDKAKYVPEFNFFNMVITDLCATSSNVEKNHKFCPLGVPYDSQNKD